MHVVIPHDKGPEEIRRVAEAVMREWGEYDGDRLHISRAESQWDGARLLYTLTAAAGRFSMPIVGWIECGDKDIVVELSLPKVPAWVPLPQRLILGRLEQRFRRLLGTAQ